MKRFTFLMFSLIVTLVASAETVTPPEGAKIQYFSRTGSFYDTDYETGDFIEGKQSGCIRVAFDGKDVYIENLIMSINNGNWVKGTLSDNGKTITIAADNILTEETLTLPVGEGDEPQYKDFKGIMRASMLKYTLGTGKYAFEPDPDTPITLTIDGDNISLENTAKDMEVLGTIYAEFTDEAAEYNDKWTGTGSDYSTVLTKFNEVPVTVPEGAVAEEYQMKYTGAYSDEPEYAFVKFYSVDDSVYIKGFYAGDDSYAIKGVRQGDKFHFDAPQFMGISYGYIMEITSCTYTKDPDEWGGYSFNFSDKGSFDLSYDEETHTYSLPQGEAMRLYVRGQEGPGWAQFCDFTVYPYEPKLLTPQEPLVEDVADYYDLEGDWGVFFSYSETSMEGEPLNTDSLKYRFYINDELYTFDADRYDLEEDLTDIPFSMVGNRFFQPNYYGVQVYILEKEISKVGLELVYRIKGEEACSTRNEYVIDGIKNVNVVADSNAPRYDLTGNRVSKNYHGVVICNGKKMIQK